MPSNKLILLDIFSCSCMNCLRSLEFIKKIDAMYKGLGLDTILVHPPEWEFEKDSKNISDAIKKHGISLPVIIDKSKRIIKKLKISFWPAQVLVKDGAVLYSHIGEGNYKKLEETIIKLLDADNANPKRVFAREPKYSEFPAVYCGRKNHGKILKFENKLKFGEVYTKGKWVQEKEFIRNNGAGSSLTILTKGKTITFVAESANKKTVKVDIKLNGRHIKSLAINKPQLYKIIKLKEAKGNRLALAADSELRVYSFSFQ